MDEVSLDIENDLDKIIHFSNMNQQGVKVLGANNGSQNKNGNNGDGTATYSGFPADRLNDELSGIAGRVARFNVCTLILRCSSVSPKRPRS